MAVNFNDLLNVQADDIKKPEVLPGGTYKLQVKDYVMDETKPRDKDKTPTPYVQFNFTILEASDDVDEDLLNAATETQPLHKRSLRSTFYVTADAQWRLKTFLTDHLQLSGGRSLLEIVQEATGQVVMAQVSQRPSQKPGDDSVYNEITAFAPAE